MRSKLFHMGIRSTVSRNNLSNANERRDWRIYAEFAQVLIAEARRLYTDEDLGVDLNATVYALDSTTIDLCLSVFPLGALPPYQGGDQTAYLAQPARRHSRVRSDLGRKTARCHALDHLIPCPGAYYIMDRGYLDFGRLYRLHSARSLFVTRAKANFKFRRRYSHPVDRTTGLICDQTVLLSTFYPAKAYPEPLRRIKFFDVTTDLRLVFLTNDFASPALTIARLYKLRWQIELFFKWIKQHLRIKAFYGTSPNAVKTQIWIALSTYLLIAIIRKRLYLELPLYTILQVPSVSLFEKTPILQAFQDMHYITQNSDIHKQLMLFD